MTFLFTLARPFTKSMVGEKNVFDEVFYTCSYSTRSSSVDSALSLTRPIYLSWHVPGREERKRMERG